MKHIKIENGDTKELVDTIDILTQRLEKIVDTVNDLYKIVADIKAEMKQHKDRKKLVRQRLMSKLNQMGADPNNPLVRLINKNTQEE